jgi:cysteinyl-tRNA synthetase
MPIRLYNTLTRNKDEFRAIDDKNVRLYVCGPTVYDYAHIGNARPFIVFDVLYRLLRHVYGAGRVRYVRNITDVDDKINARAAERGVSIRELTEETNRVFQADVAAIGCLPPDAQPRATEHIAQMIEIIARLIDNGHAYAADGHVLFDVPSMADYGRLSRRPLDEMLAGARVDVAPYKRGDMDFVLWKPSKAGEPSWPSPWGPGRPGWHVECSAMSWRHLGETFDIHGGGVDLVFPHHENEIAQTRCAFGRDVMANYWMHNGFLQVEGEKMSKSLGNFITIHELLDTEKFGGRKWPGDAVRWAMLQTHYRQPIDWTVERLEEADNELEAIAKLLGETKTEAVPPAAFIDALADDLNTAGAMAVLRGLEKQARSAAEDAEGPKARESLQASLDLLGIDLRARANIRALTEKEQSLIASRNAARAARNWAESDRIRDELAAMGIALKDNKDGTTSWEVKR